MKRAGRESAIANPMALVLSVLFVFTATALLAPAAGSGQLVLVKDGRPVSSIVIGDNASPVESHAARELQQYIERISGALLPIRKCRDRPVGSRILLGTPSSNSEIKTLKKQMRQLSTLGREGFVIMQIGSDLVIAGQGSHGVLYGTYTFLEKDLGCRWFFPGEAGEVVPRRPTIALKHVEEVGKPSLAYRGLGVFQTSGHQYDQTIIDWMARNKLNAKPTHHHVIGLNRKIGFEDPPTSTETQYEAMTTRAIVPDTNVHSFWWLLPAKDYFDAHPEYYPLVKGTRVRPDNPGSIDVQLCLSNPNVLSLVVSKTKEFFARYPAVDIMGVTPNDNHTGTGWCECDHCKAMGKTQTDRLVAFVNQVAGQIGKTCPGKCIGTLAYSDCTPPPSVKPLDNVIVEYVRNGRCYRHALHDPRCKMNRLRATEIRGWLRVVKASHLFWGDFTDPMDDLPQPTASVIAEDAKWFHTMGMGGFMVGTTPASWPMLKLDHYVAAKVGWDANSTCEDLLEDFCRNYFGPAAAPMKGYYQALDRAVQQSPACFVRGDMTTLSEIFSPRLMLELKGRFSEAQRLAGGNREVNARVAAEEECYTRFVRVLLGRTDVEELGKANLLSNPGFEEGQRSWNPVVQRGRYDLLIDTSSHSGRGSARAVCVESGRAVWQQVINVEKGKKYYFSAWAKAQAKPPGTTLLWLHQGPSHLTGKLAYLEAEAEGQWRRYIIPEITTLEDTLTVFLMSDGPGTIWFDDLVLQQIEK